MIDPVLAGVAAVVEAETENVGLVLTRETVADDVAGWDSVAHSRIMIRIEETFGIVVEDDRMYSFANVGELVDYICLRQAPASREALSARANAPAEARNAAASLAAPVKLNGGATPKSGKHAPADDTHGAVEEAAPSANKAPIFNLFGPARYPAPYSMFHDKPGVAPGRAPNRCGFNSTVVPELPKPAGEKRVLVFGNSTIRGGDIIRAMRQHCADARQYDVAIYNFGMISANCYQSLMYLVFQGLDFDPDLVVTFDGYSDIGLQPVGYDPRPGYPYNQHMLEVIHEWMGTGRIEQMDFVREERKRRDDLRKAVGWKTPEWERELVDTYVAAIRKFHMICRAYGVSVLSCLQPTLAFKQHRAGKEATRAPAVLIEHVRRTYTEARRQLATMKREMESPHHRFEDYSDLFENVQVECFTDMVHVRKDFYAQIGSRLGRAVLEMTSGPLGDEAP